MGGEIAGTSVIVSARLVPSDGTSAEVLFHGTEGVYIHIGGVASLIT